MTAPIWITFAIVAAFGVAAHLVIWSRADTWARPAAVLMFLAAIPLTSAAVAEMLGRHKPVSLAYALGCEDCLVLTAKIVQDKAIYLYINDPERVEPWPLVLPFTNEAADAVQKAIDGAPEGREGQFIARIDPESQDSEWAFHAVPQEPALPPKPEPDEGIEFVQPEG